MAVNNNPNVGIAFGLVIGAGAATALGAAVVFFPSLVKLASRRVLASALGISAGVMTYVSFVEIFAKSSGSFEDAGFSEEDAYLYSTLCFFGGVVVMLLVDLCVRLLSRGGGGHSHGHHHHEMGMDVVGDEHEHPEDLGPGPLSTAEDPAGDLDKLRQQADEVAAGHFANQAPVQNEPTPGIEVEGDNEGEDPSIVKKPVTVDSSSEKQKLVKMGVNTAIAIGLHNFPEGLATFVAALDDPRVGAVLAIAIGIHNIPEGLCVALPIYYATGNRCKAFMWALISGASEPLAALLGWAILANSFSDQLYAILFGFVAGMMVIISTRELLPTAHRYDPDDSVVTFSFIGGMIIMALSLVLFTL